MHEPATLELLIFALCAVGLSSAVRGLSRINAFVTGSRLKRRDYEDESNRLQAEALPPAGPICPNCHQEMEPRWALGWWVCPRDLHLVSMDQPRYACSCAGCKTRRGESMQEPQESPEASGIRIVEDDVE